MEKECARADDSYDIYGDMSWNKYKSRASVNYSVVKGEIRIFAAQPRPHDTFKKVISMEPYVLLTSGPFSGQPIPPILHEVDADSLR